MSELQLYVCKTFMILHKHKKGTTDKQDALTAINKSSQIGTVNCTFGSLIGFCSFSQFTLHDKISAYQIILISGRNIWDRGLEEDFVNFMTERT